jgi:hypothetical protein
MGTLRKLFVIIASVITCLAIALPCFSIANPDGGPTIDDVYAFRNVIDSGDMLFIVDESTDYTVLPAESATEAFIVKLIDTDGTTQLGSATIYNFHDKGWGESIIALYFSAASVTAKTMGWLDAFTVRLDGNPVLTWPGAPPSDTATITNWSSNINTSLVQNELAILILGLADSLNVDWSYVGTSLTLIQSTSDGNKLSAVGQAYFQGVLPGIQSIAPNAFSVSVTSPTIHKRTYGSGGATGLAGQLTGTPYDLTPVATSLGLTLGWLNSIIVLIIVVVIDYLMVRKQMSTKGIVMVDCFVFIMAAVMGVLPLMIVLGGATLCVLAIVNVFFFSKSAT